MELFKIVQLEKVIKLQLVVCLKQIRRHTWRLRAVYKKNEYRMTY